MLNLPSNIQEQISDFYSRKSVLTHAEELLAGPLVEAIISALDIGELRVATRDIDGSWHTRQWIKQAILLSFALKKNKLIESPNSNYFDKVPLKFDGKDEAYFVENKLRVVPGAIVRRGAYLGKSVVVMPSFINVGAHIDDNTMIDSNATVGSCAQIGKNVHLSDGAGIGGVLEPLQATPTIIEDDCFIGAKSEIVEGVVVGRGSVIGMGVFIGKSTKIFDRNTGKLLPSGVIPPHSVVVSGSIPSEDGSHSIYSAIIVKSVDAKTKSSTSINEILRDYND